MADPAADAILHYHERTKHHLDRYARSLGYMDWANQPDPFRVYAGAPRVALPLMAADPPVGHRGLFEPVRPPAPLRLTTIAGILELSMGLSAWKENASAYHGQRHYFFEPQGRQGSPQAGGGRLAGR